MTTFPFGFRFWHAIAKRYVDPGSHAIVGDGEMLYYEREGDIREWGWQLVALDLTCVKPEPWTGFLAKDGTRIYLNDIVRFTYDVGDFALMDMDDREQAAQRMMIGKAFVGQVVWRLGAFSVDCPLGPGEHAATIQFAPLYAGGAEVLGNVNEHPDWRAKWLPDYGWMRNGA